jgi:hypothetical protein
MDQESELYLLGSSILCPGLGGGGLGLRIVLVVQQLLVNINVVVGQFEEVLAGGCDLKRCHQ